MASRLAEVVFQRSSQDQAAAKQWLNENRANVPDSVAQCLDITLELVGEIHKLESSNRAAHRHFLRCLGVLPRTERRRSRSGKSLDADEPRASKQKVVDPIARLLQVEERSTTLSTWHRKCATRHKRDGRRAKEKRMKLELEREAELDDEEPLTPEEEAELARQDAEALARSKLGGGADPVFAPHAEALMRGANSMLRHEEVELNVDRETLPRDAVVKQVFYESRERIDFHFTVTAMDCQIEKMALQTPRGPTLVTGDMTEVGPPKMRVTWRFLANMVILASNYVMPFNRFARLASSPSKRFTAAEISRYYQFAAGHFVPIYLHLGRSLAQAPVLTGDDTPALVLEVSKALSKELGQDTTTACLPWDAFASAEKARSSLQAGAAPSASLVVAAEFGFASARKDGTGMKSGFNTTVLSGRADATDAKSTIVFYRSHLGGLGNLLDAVLQHRHAEHRTLVIQSDLSTVNLVSDPILLERFDVHLAGCASHARRPFAIHEQDDSQICSHILHRFKGIPIYEGLIDAHGRNAVNTLAVRGSDEREQWDEIRELCEEVAQKWSRATPLGEGARYVLRHFDRLTYYLTDARVRPDNNFSERMLRLEKLIARNSLFRQTLEGRVALDVMRTMLQTATAAEVDPMAYVMWVMHMPKDTVAADPAAFTPAAFSRWWQAQDAIEESMAETQAAG
jgi:hypothetical protein